MGRYSDAEGYFQQANDLEAAARNAVKNGDTMSAAETYENAGRLDEAAPLYLQAGVNQKALDCYTRLGQTDQILRLIELGAYSEDAIDILEKDGCWLEAGEAALKQGHFERAARDLEQSADRQRLIAGLETMRAKQPLSWVLESLAQNYRKEGRFSQEAGCYEALGRIKEAAAACERAAHQAKHLTPYRQDVTISFFRKAWQYYQQEGYLQFAEECWQQVVIADQLPVITVMGKAEKSFEQGERNTLRLKITNVGFDKASDIHLEVGTPEEGWKVIGMRVTDQKSSSQPARPSDSCEFCCVSLAQGEALELVVYIQVQGDIFGTTPLTLAWRWKSRREDEEFRRDYTTDVVVRKHADSPFGAASPVFQGPVTITQIGGDKIEGDFLQAGAEKIDGGKVEIKKTGGRSSARRQSAGDASENDDPSKHAPIDQGSAAEHRLCPICHLEVPGKAIFCDGCGNPISPQALAGSAG
jgi:hypothetical protein